MEIVINFSKCFQMAGAPLPESGKVGESSKSKGMSDEEIEAQLAKLRG